MSISSTTGNAYIRTHDLSIREIVHQLNAALGATLVSGLAGNKDPKISYRWARVGESEPREAAQSRLITAHRVLNEIVSSKGEHVARMWFIGCSPWLDEDTPSRHLPRTAIRTSSLPPRRLSRDHSPDEPDMLVDRHRLS